jgi:hypothetical protein
VTSEELEQSLKAEFESYLNGSFDAVRQEFAEFQRNFETEFAKHKAQLDEAVQKMASRLESGTELDRAFTESVVEHLRLSRDEGAKLTATALSEAEKLEPLPVTNSRLDLINRALDDISSRKTQADILGALVEHSAQFAPRGVFFIVRHDQLTAWKSFGEGVGDGGQSAEGVRLPISADTILANAVNSLVTQESSGADAGDNNLFLDPLALGSPERMYAIPLRARGRGVAVLYVDLGTDGLAINVDALEMMVRTAGLTVELRAAGQHAPAEVAHAEQHASASEQVPEAAAPSVEAEQEPDIAEEAAPEVEAVEYEAEVQEVEAEPEPELEPEPEVYEISEVEPQAEPASAEYDIQAAEPEPEPEPEAAPEPEPAVPAYTNGHAFQPEAAPVMEAATVAARPSARNIELPIEVTDDERKYHTNARRFARLLVSEIKLYNEQKVSEGRESGDIYDRLREAIERSREMYEKRVEPQVAARFDYFHYELINDLAEGDAARLGSSYPGAAV